MQLIECTQCGSNELFEEHSYIVCAYCQSQFAPRAADVVPLRETVIAVHSDIQVLLRKCADDPANRRRYASLILDIVPTNHIAASYLRQKDRI